MSERFGGWYVTGTHGAQTHMGNVAVQDREHPEVLDRAAGANVTDLSSRFDTSPYLSPHSDIVAQLVQAHQTQMHNLITLTNYQTRIALYEEAAKNRAAGLPEGTLSDAARAQIRAARRRARALPDFRRRSAARRRGQGHVGFRRGVRRARSARRARALACATSTCARACSSIRSAT